MCDMFHPLKLMEFAKKPDHGKSDDGDASGAGLTSHF